MPKDYTMKQTIILLSFFTHLTVFGQAPNLINYQGVARDNSGNELVNQSISLQLSILEDNSNGTVVYSETHFTTTNDFGLFNTHIGNGTLTSGAFSNIDWGGHSHFLKVEMDASGGSNYTLLGTSQLVSVPYALYAAESGSSTPGPQGIQGVSGLGPCDYIKSGEGRIVVYSNSHAYGYGKTSAGSSFWAEIQLNGVFEGAIASDSTVVIYTSTNAYGFGETFSGTSAWYTVALSGAPLGAFSASGNIVVYTASNAYGFGETSAGSSAWFTTNLVGQPLGGVGSGNKIAVFTTDNAYGFGETFSGTSSWNTIPIIGTPTDIIGTK
jgi:hypothetical protein